MPSTQPPLPGITGEREELRIALVMNGGVSLAVWMGGVTNEIFRLVTQQHAVYRRLQDMTRTTARVDVVSGTSAGGVNGAALSVALLYGGDFSQLRNVWLTTGALADLLRPPLGKNPGSLLSGDEFFLPNIEHAFQALAGSAPKRFTPGDMPLDLRLTTTLLTGRPGNTVDDLGVGVNDKDYRASFEFLHTEDRDDFKNKERILPLLARAARSTASFPFAFEPSLVPADGGMDIHLKDAAGKLLATPRYVIDGGILDNKPFRGALKAIFGMGRRGSVRRVLAYVNPDPGDGTPPADLGKTAPPLAAVLTDSILGIPQSQSIADQLQDIQEHNDKIRARRDSVVSLVQSLQSDPHTIDALAGQLFGAYRTRRIASTFELFVYQALPEAVVRARAKAGDASPTLQVVGKHGREQMKTTFTAMPWHAWIPLHWPDTPEHAAYQPDTWEWGLFPVEFGAKVMLDMLRKIQSLDDYAQHPSPAPLHRGAAGGDAELRQSQAWSDDDATTPSPPLTPPAAAAAPAGPGAAAPWWQRGLHVVHRGLASIAAPPADAPVRTWNPEALKAAASAAAMAAPSDLGQLWTDAYALVDRLTAQRQREQPLWDRRADRLLRAINGWPVRGVATRPAGMATARDFAAMFAFLGTPRRRAACSAMSYEIARILQKAARLALRVAADSKASGRLRPHDVEQANGLEALARFFASEGAPEDPAARRRLLSKLMGLEVIEFAFNDHDALSSDTVIELVQISGNAASPIGHASAARDKLLGLQLAHFGAFYKRSWRANDWTYGRLDGAERLVKILLNPERLHRFYYRRAADAVAEIKDIALDAVPSEVLREELRRHWIDEDRDRQLRDELAFLDDVQQTLPDTLPVCAAVLTTRLHYGVLREELPQLLSAIAADQAQGADTQGDGAALLRTFGAAADDGRTTRPFSPEMARLALQQDLIAGERLIDEAGSDLFTRTLAHTAATLQSLLSSKTTQLGPVSLFFASLKLPIMGFYFVARGLTRQSRTSAALNGGILVAGIVLVAMQFAFDRDEMAKASHGGFATLGWALLAYGLAFSVVSAPRTLGTLVLLALAAFGWHYQLLPVLAIVGVGTVLTVSVWFPTLQWLLGFAAVVFAALWTSGALPPASADPKVDIRYLAALICLVLALALWQASPMSARLEHWARARIKQVLAAWRRLRQRMAGNG